MFGKEKSTLDRGLDAFQHKRWKSARRLLEEAESEGERAIGAYHLGILYWRGLGGERDHRAAVDYFARAAAGGHAAAQAAYGMALKAGDGVPQDLDAARNELRSAAGGGNPDAMTALAEISDDEDARRWLARASEQGHAPAMRALAEFNINDDPVEALSLLYAHASLTASHASSKRAAALAREMSAREIDEAQKNGRSLVKQVRKGRG